MASRAETRQLPLDLAPKTSFAREEFMRADCNRRGHDRVLGWRSWPEAKLVLSGPAASGKTHLAHIWAGEADAALIRAESLSNLDVGTLGRNGVVVEDADQVAGDTERERRLFHLHNAMQQNGQPLMLTSRAEPGRWGIVLPDLASRIAAAPHVRLDPPDDALLAAVLVKLFHDRQLHIEPSLIGWLVARMDRSFSAARDVVARLDAAALASRGPVTRRMAAPILDNLQDETS